MKTKNIFKKYSILIKSLIISTFILIGIQTVVQSQTSLYTKPSLFIGGAVGANFNFYRGSTQTLNADLISYPAFHKGTGVGLYLAPLIEYHKPNKVFGVMLQVGYDSRKGKFDQVTTPCNCPADLKTNLSYITIEPNLRVAPFKGNLYLYAGPRFAVNVGKDFTYEKGASADGTIPADPQLKGEFSNMHKSIFSMQVGAGYDLYLSSQDKKTQYVLSPFVVLHPYFGQNPRTIETWNNTTVRAGIAFKFGKGKKITPVKAPVQVQVVESTPVPVVVIPVIVPEPKPVPEPTPVVTMPINVVKNYTLFFEFDKSNLDNQTIKDLNNLIESLNKDPEIGLVIKSYADSRGTDIYNISLSGRRGKAVVDYMISKGIDVSRINSKALGETISFDKNTDSKNSEANYALNRRSNVVIVDIVSK